MSRCGGAGRIAGLLLVAGVARAPVARAQTAELGAGDFTLQLAVVDSADSSKETPLGQTALESYLGRARCLCPGGLLARLSLSASGQTKIGGATVTAELKVGSDCGESAAAAAACVSLASDLSVDGSKKSTAQSVETAALFAAAGGGKAPDCENLKAAATRLWAVLHVEDKRLASHPSLAFKVVAAAKVPKAPTAVGAQVAEGGLLVSWTAGASDQLAGHQVLCSPGPARPPAAAYESCQAPDNAAGPAITADGRFVCSDLVPAGESKVRLAGLENGRAYTVAVVAVGKDGSPSAPSATATGTPGPTAGFFDVYQAEGGQAQGGCSLAGRGEASPAILLLVLALVAFRRTRIGCVLLLALLSGERPARADTSVGESHAAPDESPRRWNLELRLGPYRPHIDDELAASGSQARPFEEVFSNRPRMMWQLELDRQVLQRGGTLAVGVGIGRYQASAAALTADRKSRSGDQTTLVVMPLSIAAVYRADWIYRRWAVPFVPFVKLGLDQAWWSATHTGRGDNPQGWTAGWHASVGVAMYLEALDPETARSLDRETGVNHAALFLEGTHYQLDGLGAGQKLHLGDTTWFAGLMLEL